MKTRHSKYPHMLVVVMSIFSISIMTLAMYVSQSVAANQHPSITNSIVTSTDKLQVNQLQYKPKIQLAILLDTSSSMSGLIDQSRQQIWQVVNEFTQATQNGIKPTLEVAVFEYGNDRLSDKTGYIRQVSGLTTELDQVSEALFSLKTGGGQEYCGYVIKTAVNDLNWSVSNNDVKVIFIAGNEPFTQGPVSYQKAIGLAKQKGVVVNTIHAGDHNEGARGGWKDGAMLAGGDFMSIDHNHTVAHIEAPQDQRIAELNDQLNQTYIPYGAQGEAKVLRQKKQDTNSSRLSIGLLAKRAKSKASAYYENSNWDLVDAISKKKLKVEEMSEDELPTEMRSMNDKEKQQFVKQAADKRKNIKQEILTLSKQRDTFVATEKAKQAKENIQTMDDALTQAVRKQASSKNFNIN